MVNEYKRPESFTGRIADEHIPYRREVRESDDVSGTRESKKSYYGRNKNIGILNIDHTKRPENVSYFWVSIRGENGRRNYNNMVKAEMVQGRLVPKKRHPEIPSMTESMHNFIFRAGTTLTENATAALTEQYSRLDSEMEREYIIVNDLILMERDAYLDAEDREEIQEAHERALYPYTPEGFASKPHILKPWIEIERSY